MAERAAAPAALVPAPLKPPAEPDEAAPPQTDAQPETPKKETLEEAMVNAERPLPTDPKTFYLGGLFFLAVLVACYFAQPIIVPVVMAFFLKMLLQPIVRLLARCRIPRPVSALLAMVMLAGVLVGLGFALSMPAASWGKTLSEGFPRLEQKLQPLQGPIRGLQEFLTKAEQAAGGGKEATPVAVERIGVFGLVFSGTRAALEGLLTTAVVLFFLMLSGDTFLRRGVEIMPNFEHKRRAVEISQQVEADVSTYLSTIIIMNVIVGLAVGIVMWLCGMPDPLLWAAIAFTLNFVPILGPFVGLGLFVLAGFMQFNEVGLALMPAALYLAIHVIEGELVTPAILARRFTLNPVAVIISIIFWYWMWGVPGAVLAVPMLAISKIICDRIKPLMALGHMLEGEEEGAAARYVARLTRRTAPAPARKSD
ncbi:AI-2E family transporter [Dongia sedimenti]|uniref:AI-2E family transporter n=1 Tax=Dongia sedimenti TaxID=3064282 RepID=A0ABU0YSI7_9PROT|nr:AI-2E family transporter [Rhodospirillaceae bacterium R-7]